MLSTVEEQRRRPPLLLPDDYYERVKPTYADKPFCPVCNDSKFVRTSRWKEGRNGKEAEIKPCPACTGRDRADIEGRMMRYSDTPLRFMEATLENFEPVAGTGEALSAAQDFAEGRLETLVLVGSTGTGKTHLAVAAARARGMAEAPQFFFLNVPNFLKRVRATYGSKEGTQEADLTGPAENWAVAIIDDLGAEYGTPWVAELVYCIIDSRYRERLATVVTTNVEPSGWEPRVRSRLMDRQGARVCFIMAEDYRGRGA